MKALINPNEETKYISLWNEKTPVYTVLGQRVCEVAENNFPVAKPLFWIDCNNDVIADLYYYDAITQSILIKPIDAEAPKQASSNQPTTSGTQTI
jgi:hypothetical protein